MALTYRNTLKDHLVEVPEPADIIAAAEVEAERLFRKGTKRDRLDGELVADRARAQALAQRQTLTKMDESRRWERVAAPAVTQVIPVPAQQAEADAPAKPVKAAAKKETEA
jgi:hypothetical protein